MDSSRLLLFLFMNIAFLLVAILAFFVVSIYRQRNRGKSNAFLSKLEPALQILGFTKREWQRGIPFMPFEMLDGYYQGLAQGKQYEIHIFPEGTRRYQTNPQMEIVLLGYFYARLSASTPHWHKINPHLPWMMPKELILPGCDNLVFHTADENSGQFLLSEPVSRDPILALLGSQKTASVLIAPRDIHFSIQLDNPDNLSLITIQDWLRNLAEIAKVAAALPPLAPEALSDFQPLAGKNRASKKKLLLLMLLLLLLTPLIIIFLLLTQ